MLVQIQQHGHTVYVLDADHQDTLVKGLKPAINVLPQMRFALKPRVSATWDLTHIIRHVAGEDAIKRWQKDGTLVIDGLVDFLEPSKSSLNKNSTSTTITTIPKDATRGGCATCSTA
jgi:hypothetical protein